MNELMHTQRPDRHIYMRHVARRAKIVAQIIGQIIGLYTKENSEARLSDCPSARNFLSWEDFKGVP